MPVKILIADDHKIIREGLVSLISQINEMDVVAETGDGREAVTLAKKLFPDVVIMDINMPGLNGIDAARTILKDQPEIKIIVLSVHSTTKFVREALSTGVKGYLVKHCAFEELENAVKKMMNNEFFLSSQIVGNVLDDYIGNIPRKNHTAFEMLSSREREVLQHIAEGATSDEIASRLFISKKTVSSHRRQIMKKLNLKGVAQLTRYAINEGIISPDF